MGIQPLPRWVWIGAAVLAAVAGMVNVVGYLGVEQHAVSHLTGTTSLIGAAIADGNWPALRALAAVVLAFMAGATVSALVIGESTLQLGRRYGVVLAMEAALLALAVPMFAHGSTLGAVCAAAACGLQNAMATTYSGAVVRTTHVSGMFTDLAIAIGHAARGLPLQRRRITLCLVIIGGFLAGSIGGARLFHALGYHALLVPAALTGVVGIGHAGLRHARLRRS